MFQDVGLSWIIEPKEKSGLVLGSSVILRFKMGLGIINVFVQI